MSRLILLIALIVLFCACALVDHASAQWGWGGGPWGGRWGGWSGRWGGGPWGGWRGGWGRGWGFAGQ
uniref:Uncharacterized protein n=1 Tax=Globodera pallida TaxID=36090 RepID=A0A183BQE7_GLOPA